MTDQERIEELEEDKSDLLYCNAELIQENLGLTDKLHAITSLAVAAGLCHDTPHSRREWAEGRGWTT